jgi:hypothetical protein
METLITMQVGHIEDIVVDHSVRSKGFGKMYALLEILSRSLIFSVIEELKLLAVRYNCYKVILNSSEKNAPFYEVCICSYSNC